MKRSVASALSLAFGIVVAWQVGAWVLVGRQALPKRVAALAEIDLLYFRE